MGTIKPLKRVHDHQMAGDTIVEVLIAIAIAAFAIGISYATANRSLQQAVTAQERNQALNILENQLTDLKLRQQKTAPTDFENTFGYSAPNANNFCLDDSATDPTASNWGPVTNAGTITGHENNLATPTPYNTTCAQLANGNYYYVNIVTTGSSATVSPTVYQIFVRWSPLNGNVVNQASIYYRF